MTLGALRWLANCLLRGAPVQTSDSERAALARLVRERARAGIRILEIGSWMGASAVTLGEIASEWDGRLVCVDSWRGEEALNAWIARHRDVYASFWRRVERAGLSGVVIPMRGLCADVLPMLASGAFDAVWIDGDHRYEGASFDIAQARRLVKAGGLVCGHDYDGQHPGVIQAVDEAFGAAVRHEGRVWWVAR